MNEKVNVRIFNVFALLPESSINELIHVFVIQEWLGVFIAKNICVLTLGLNLR